MFVMVLGLAACGGDGGGNGDSAQNQDGGAAETPLSDEQLGKGAPQGATGATELQLDTQTPARRLTKRERELLQAAPMPQADVKKFERQIYESSRFFCKEAGIEGMRREYSIKSSDPKDIAQEAARRTYGRGGAEAVYSGCLAGLTGE